MTSQNSQLESIVQSAVETAGCELWHVDWLKQGKHSVIRVTIESAGGVTADDCARVSRQVDSELTVEDMMPANCHLEISSPGLDRQLHNATQCARYLDATVSVKRRQADTAGRKKIEGTLKGADESGVTVLLDEEDICISWQELDKVQLVPVW